MTYTLTNVGIVDMKNDYRVVPFDMKWGRVCITPCMMIDNGDGQRPMVGSAKCRECGRFVDIDRNENIVICNKVTPRKRDYGQIVNKKKPVICVNTGIIYESITLAAKDIDCSLATIGKAIKDGRLVKKIWKFEYVE